MKDNIKPEFLDIINFAVCQTVNEYLGERSAGFFKRVGEHHLEEASRRGLVKIDVREKPLDNLIQIARYLESAGYMEKIWIHKLSENEADVEMLGVTVTQSSVSMLKEGKQPSHYMTNIMIAALEKLGVRAELTDTAFDEKQRHFKEHWKIL